MSISFVSEIMAVKMWRWCAQWFGVVRQKVVPPGRCGLSWFQERDISECFFFFFLCSCCWYVSAANFRQAHKVRNLPLKVWSAGRYRGKVIMGSVQRRNRRQRARLCALWGETSEARETSSASVMNTLSWNTSVAAGPLLPASSFILDILVSFSGFFFFISSVRPLVIYSQRIK